MRWPRYDPQPGDEFKKPHHDIMIGARVVERDAWRVGYQLYEVGGWGKTMYTPIKSWRHWIATASVVGPERIKP